MLKGVFKRLANTGTIDFGGSSPTPASGEIRDSAGISLSELSAEYVGTVANAGNVPVRVKFRTEVLVAGKLVRFVESEPFNIAVGAVQTLPHWSISIGVVKDGQPPKGFHIPLHCSSDPGGANQWCDVLVVSDGPVKEVPRFWFRKEDGTIFHRPWAATVYTDDPPGAISAIARVIGVDGAALAEYAEDLQITVLH